MSQFEGDAFKYLVHLDIGLRIKRFASGNGAKLVEKCLSIVTDGRLKQDEFRVPSVRRSQFGAPIFHRELSWIRKPLSQFSRGNSRDNGVRRNVSCYHGPGSYDRTSSDSTVSDHNAAEAHEIVALQNDR